MSVLLKSNQENLSSTAIKIALTTCTGTSQTKSHIVQLNTHKKLREFEVGEA
jgi:hypothetical protein